MTMETRFTGTIIVDGGIVFLGSIEQFEDSFFSNPTLEGIKDFCRKHKFHVEFRNEVNPVDAFVGAVMDRIARRFDLSQIDQSDLGCTRSHIPHLFEEGFSVDDAVAYLTCMEHFNPDLDEDIALERMARIRAKYVR